MGRRGDMATTRRGLDKDTTGYGIWLFSVELWVFSQSMLVGNVSSASNQIYLQKIFMEK